MLSPNLNHLLYNFWLHQILLIPWCYSSWNYLHPFNSVQFIHSVVSDSLQTHGLLTRLSCPSPTPGVYSNSCPSSWWCHPTISSSGISFASCLQSVPASGSFPMSQFFALGGQSTRSFSFSISPSNEESGLIFFRMNWLDLSAVQGTLKSLLQHHSSKASILWHSAFFIVQFSHPHMTTGKTKALTRRHPLNYCNCLLNSFTLSSLYPFYIVVTYIN